MSICRCYWDDHNGYLSVNIGLHPRKLWCVEKMKKKTNKWQTSCLICSVAGHNWLTWSALATWKALLVLEPLTKRIFGAQDGLPKRKQKIHFSFFGRRRQAGRGNYHSNPPAFRWRRKCQGDVGIVVKFAPRLKESLVIFFSPLQMRTPIERYCFTKGPFFRPEPCVDVGCFLYSEAERV